MKLRDYQVNLSNEGTEILKRKNLVIYAVEVRCGKTLIALQTAQNFGAKSVLFVTKIKAFSSIQWDYDQMNYDFKLTIINKESLHKVNQEFDLIIYDEFHGFSAYPKASKYQKDARAKYSHLPMILLSGTPTPESHSQWFHSLQLSDHSPFKEYSNFYKWAADFVNVKTKHLGYAQVNDYSDADIRHINRGIKNYVLTFTQKEAGFVSTVNEMVLFVDMQPITNLVIERLKKNLVVKNTQGQVILADTGVKLMQKEHQLWSGTCKFEDGTSKTIDNTKAVFIYYYFKGKKIAIYYKFKEELVMLQEVFGSNLTTDLEEFNATNKNIALQFVSGREGLSLRNADYIVALNIDFSATTYWQFRDRMTTIERKENTIYWIFAKGGIENKIYNTVQQKKNFTLNIYKK